MSGKDNEVVARGGVCGPKFSARYMIAVLSSVGLGIVYGLKVNLHVAIVSMVNHTALNHPSDTANASSLNSTTKDAEASEDGPFVWSSNIQGIILSAYFWGYIVAQLPGGRVAELLSAKWVMFFAVAINIVCALLTPVMAELHYAALIVMRVGQGIGGGVTFPANHVILAHWAPPAERSVMSSIVYAGTALGTVVFMLLSGIIAAGVSWQAIFYILGGVSAVWMVLWVWLVADSPQQMAYISEEERNFISSALERESGSHKKSKKSKMPWKAALTSGPFLAILIAHTCSNWGWYMVLIELPSYMKNVLNFKISENAILTAIPFLCMWFFSLILSKVLDTLRSKNIISTTMARKIATVIASFIPLICFVVLCYISSDQKTVAVVMMTLAVTAIGGMFSGFLSNHIDIAPNYAGTLVAITNTVASIPGIVVPVFVGELTHDDPSIASWRIIFWTTIALYIVEIFVYVIFGSGEVQPWNKLVDDDDIEEQPLKAPQDSKDYASTNK